METAETAKAFRPFYRFLFWAAFCLRNFGMHQPVEVRVELSAELRTPVTVDLARRTPALRADDRGEKLLGDFAAGS